MIISIYDMDNKLIKQSQIELGIDKLNSKYINSYLTKMKKRILTKPKTKKDIDDFNTKQARRLNDNIY